MTVGEKKVKVSKIKCPKCGKLNPLDAARCINCETTIQWSVAHHYCIINEEASQGLGAAIWGKRSQPNM